MIAIIVNLAIRRICSQSKPCMARKDRRNKGEWKREKRQAPFARTRPSSARSAPLPPPPPPQISYAHRTYKRLETASFGPNDSDPSGSEGETWRGEE